MPGMASASEARKRIAMMMNASIHCTAIMTVKNWATPRARAISMEAQGTHMETLTSRENRQRKAKCPIFEDDDVEAPIDQPRPDEDVGSDTCGEVSGMDSDGAGPVQAHKGPCKGCRKDSDVCQLRCLWVLEVCKGEVEKVHDLEEQSPAEVRPAPQVDEAELQQVVVGEGRCEIGRCGQGFGREVGLEKRGEIWNLEDVEHDPEQLC